MIRKMSTVITFRSFYRRLFFDMFIEISRERRMLKNHRDSETKRRDKEKRQRKETKRRDEPTTP